jgi:glycosyltransferase involved in cell wall biosynthesis
MAAGTPVVASDLPGMAAIVRATGCGVLVDPGSVDSVAAGLDQVLHASPEAHAAMVARCVRAHHETYAWETQEGRLLQLYEQLLATARGRADT